MMTQVPVTTETSDGLALRKSALLVKCTLLYFRTQREPRLLLLDLHTLVSFATPT